MAFIIIFRSTAAELIKIIKIVFFNVEKII
jgi:hypothetical protein